MVQNSVHICGKGINVTFIRKKSVATVTDQLMYSANICGNNRNPCSKGFQKRSGQALGTGSNQKNVKSGKYTGNVFSASKKDDIIIESHRIDHVLRLFSEGTISYKDEETIRLCFYYFCSDLYENIRSLFRAETHNRTDYFRVRAYAQLCSGFGTAASCGTELIEVHSAAYNPVIIKMT